MTRDRLVQCAACGAHIRSAEPCPFCGGEGARESSTLRGARGGVVAASLLALSACASPSGGEPDEHDTGDEVVLEPMPAPHEDPDGTTDEVGIDGDGIVDEQPTDGPPPSEELRTPDEPPPAAAYGGPPDDMINQPMYGIAPE